MVEQSRSNPQTEPECQSHQTEQAIRNLLELVSTSHHHWGRNLFSHIGRWNHNLISLLMHNIIMVNLPRAQQPDHTG